MGILTDVELAELWALLPPEFREQGIVDPRKGFIRKDYNSIKKATNGPIFIQKILDKLN